MKGKELKITYDNLDRDVFFCGLVKDGKGRKDFDDTCKCAVWEENRTKYQMVEGYRYLIDFSRGVKLMFESLMDDASSPNAKEDVMGKWVNFRNELIYQYFDEIDVARIYHYWRNFPTNVISWPKKAYLSHAPKIRKTWKYDPFEDRKRFEDVRKKSIGDKDFVDYPEGKGKKHTMKVPITIEVNPLYDVENMSRVLIDNAEVVLELANIQKKKMEKLGFIFGETGPKNERPRSWYETALRYLGHYRLFKCKGMEFHEVEAIFNKGWEKNKARAMDKDTYMKKVKGVLRNLPN